MADVPSSGPVVVGGYEAKDVLLNVEFNRNKDSFACATKNGFVIFDCHPTQERYRREFDKGGCKHVDILDRSNIVSLVGSGKSPSFPSHKVILWDDQQKSGIVELDFKKEVLRALIRETKFIVVTEDRVWLYKYPDMKPTTQISTFKNPKGVVAISSDKNSSLLACPAEKEGYVQIYNLMREDAKPLVFSAHDNAIVHLEFSRNGKMLATASKLGTLIRIFDVTTGKKLLQLRRGGDTAEITSISFNHNDSLICVSSDKPTVHIFSVDDKKSGFKNATSNMIDYAGSLWSFAQFRLHDGVKKCVCTFVGEDDDLFVICYNGHVFKSSFKGKETIDATKEKCVLTPSDFGNLDKDW